jgi:hypothetical protein
MLRFFALSLLVALFAGPAQAEGPQDIDHFLCHRVTAYDGAADVPVKLKDQFGEVALHAAKPAMVCNPVSKNGEAIKNLEAHLLCYSVTQIRNAPSERTVITDTQFGKSNLKVQGIEIFCLPAAKTLKK